MTASIQPTTSLNPAPKSGLKQVLSTLLVGMMFVSVSNAQGRRDSYVNKKINDFKSESVKKGENSKSAKDKGDEKVRVILKAIPSLKSAVEEESRNLGGKELKKLRSG